ncbi:MULTISPECIES: hypothetical protein [unclassified Leucobacter]|uniref:hypothetical protein n=1 Tax=unclassified Leucobacter TaxID=2621730 RepID=UPI000621A9E4|nr:hypothetical protein [Leucobacter sp. Ag1]KKI17107.1 hypothetical protein XM48_12060 [Leucobacter sp. Ag1]
MSDERTTTETAETVAAHRPAREGEGLFAPRSDRAHPLTIPVFVVSAILVFGGFYLMGLAPSIAGAELWLFLAGILVDTIGFWIAFGWWQARDL